MKTKKIRMPSLILMFAMILALVGCGSKVTAQGLIDDFTKKQENISYVQTINMEIEVAPGSTFTEDQKVGMEFSVVSSIKTKGDITKADMEVKLLGIKNEITSYIDAKNGLLYSNADGTWTKEKLPENSNIDMFKDAIKVDDKIENAVVDGKECYLVKGELDASSMNDILESLDIKDVNGKVEAYYAFDKKTKELVQIDADFTEMMNKYIGDSFENYNATFKVCNIVVNNIETGNVEDIVIPEEALNAVVIEEATNEDENEFVEYVEDIAPPEEVEESALEEYDDNQNYNYEDIELNVIDPGFKFFQFNRTSLKIGANRLSDLINAGLTMDNDNELEPGEKDTIEIYEYDMLFEVTNMDSEKRGIKDCVITGLVTYSDIVEINGLRVGMDQNEALNLLGKPAEEEEDDGKTISHWMDEDGFYINTIVENNKVIGITVMDMGV